MIESVVRELVTRALSDTVLNIVPFEVSWNKLEPSNEEVWS